MNLELPAILLYFLLSYLVPPIPGNWGLWDDWSDCTEECGGGTQERARSCDNPEPQGGGEDCQGRSYEDRACNTFGCPGEIITTCICHNAIMP